MRVWALLLTVLPLLGGFAPVACAAANQEAPELQDQCGRLAAEYFAAEYGDGLYNNDYVDPDTRKILHDETRIAVVSHYSVKNSRCFAVITSSAVTRFDQVENSSIWITIVDLAARRDLGRLHQTNRGPYADVCFVAERSCNSREEWESLLKAYLD
jgi:hypothetical protein